MAKQLAERVRRARAEAEAAQQRERGAAGVLECFSDWVGEQGTSSVEGGGGRGVIAPEHDASERSLNRRPGLEGWQQVLSGYDQVEELLDDGDVDCALQVFSESASHARELNQAQARRQGERASGAGELAEGLATGGAVVATAGLLVLAFVSGMGGVAAALSILLSSAEVYAAVEQHGWHDPRCHRAIGTVALTAGFSTLPMSGIGRLASQPLEKAAVTALGELSDGVVGFGMQREDISVEVGAGVVDVLVRAGLIDPPAPER